MPGAISDENTSVVPQEVEQVFRELDHKRTALNQKFNNASTAFFFLGDSLSDVGSLFKRRLFGFIPMRWLTTLTNSREGRFNSMFNWVDGVVAAISGQHVSDVEWSNDSDERPFVSHDVNGHTFYNFAQGGATAVRYRMDHAYFWVGLSGLVVAVGIVCLFASIFKLWVRSGYYFWPSLAVIILAGIIFTGALVYLRRHQSESFVEAVMGDILRNMDQENNAFERVMASQDKSQDKKVHLFLWIGANDLITVPYDNDLRSRNAKRCANVVEAFVLEKIKNRNIERLYLLNLPDFRNTPWVKAYAANFKLHRRIEALLTMLVAVVLIVFVVLFSPGFTALVSWILSVASAVLSIYYLCDAARAEHYQKALEDSLNNNMQNVNKVYRSLAQDHDKVFLVDAHEVFNDLIENVQDEAGCGKLFDKEQCFKPSIDDPNYEENTDLLMHESLKQFCSKHFGKLRVFWDTVHPSTIVQRLWIAPKVMQAMLGSPVAATDISAGEHKLSVVGSSQGAAGLQNSALNGGASSGL